MVVSCCISHYYREYSRSIARKNQILFYELRSSYRRSHPFEINARFFSRNIPYKRHCSDILKWIRSNDSEWKQRRQKFWKKVLVLKVKKGGSSETPASQQLVTSGNERWGNCSTVNVKQLNSSLHYQHCKVEEFAVAKGSTVGSWSVVGKPLCYYVINPMEVIPVDLPISLCC